MTRLSTKDAQALLGHSKRSKMGNKPVWECLFCGMVYEAKPISKSMVYRPESPRAKPKPVLACNRCGEHGGKRIIKFASKREFTRWKELQQLKKAGQIRNLRRQVDFMFVVNGRQLKTPKGRPLKYRCDAVYEEYQCEDLGQEMWRKVVEDSKGRRAGLAYDLFWLKRELMAAGACPEFPEGILIRET